MKKWSAEKLEREHMFALACLADDHPETWEWLAKIEREIDRRKGQP